LLQESLLVVLANGDQWVFGRLDEEFLRMGGLEGRSLGCVGVESLGAVFEKLV